VLPEVSRAPVLSSCEHRRPLLCRRELSRSALVDVLWGDDHPANIGGALNVLMRPGQWLADKYSGGVVN
jgi:hypothetical protein